MISGYLIMGNLVKTPYYVLKYNTKKAFMSDKVLGHQAVVDFLGSKMWINIKEEWIVK
jgi:hypothetical protein